MLTDTRSLHPALGSRASSAYLESAIDCVVVADAAGRVVEFNPAAERTFGYTREQALGRPVAELIVPLALREQHLEAFKRFAADDDGRLLGRRLQLTGMRSDGSEFPVELTLSSVEGEPLLVCGVLRDLTDAERAEADLRRHAAEHGALRQVATLVAEGAPPGEVFAAVAKEVAASLDVPLTAVVRVDADGTATQVGAWGEENPFPVGTSWPLDELSVSARVVRTQRPAWVDDYSLIPGDIAAALARDAGIRTAVGVPILVEGSLWGVMMALSTAERRLLEGTEARLAAFTELIATAIASAQARDDLRRLAEEQAALRRVALLVAEEADQPEVFALVAQEASRVLDGAVIEIVRFDPDRRATVVGAWGEDRFVDGSQWTLDGPSVLASVLDTGAPARIDDYAQLSGSLAAAAREAGIRSGVGAPIVVDGRTWGVVLVISREPQPLPQETEARLARFSGLVAMAISKTEARDDVRKTHELYRQVLALPGAVPYVLDRETGTYSFIGEGIEKLTGYRPEEFTPEVLESLVLERHAHGAHSDLRIRRRDGELRWFGDGAVEIVDEHTRARTSMGFLQDVTEEIRIENEHAALRRVAIQVAEGATPHEVFASVAGEVARLLDVPAISMVRFEEDETSTAIAVWGDGNPFGVGATFRPWPGVMHQVRQTGGPARLEDFAYSTGPTTARLQAARIHSGVGVPITVEGRVWGTIIALATGGGSLPAGIAERLSNFTDLVATAIANTQARDDLRQLAEEQAALRRVALLVAEEAAQSEIFAMVAQEASRVLGGAMIEIVRCDPDRRATGVGAWGEHPFTVGSRWTLDGPSVIASVLDTGVPARIDDYGELPGSLAAAAREAGFRSAVGTPIVVDGRTWGVVLVISREPQPLPVDTETRLARFSDLVGTSISRTEARDAQRRLDDEQAALRRVATLVAEGVPAPEVIAAVAREVSEFSGLPFVEISRFDADGWLTMLGSAGDHPFQTGTRWPMDNPIGSSAIRDTLRPARIEYTEDLPGEFAAAMRAMGVRWAVGVPIVVGGKVWGEIGASLSHDGPLPADAEARLIGFTELVATAVLNAQARDELDAFVREQEALRRVATLTASGASPQEVFDSVVEEVKELLDLPVVALTRYEPDGMVLMMAAAGPHPFRKGTSWPVEGLPVASMVLERGEPAYLEEYITDDPTTGPAIQEARVRSGLAVPIIVDNKVWGTISTASTDQPLPTDIEKRLVGFTELVATAVLNAQARNELGVIADEQAALRRVATLVAEGAGSPAVYDAICQATGPVIGATSVNLCHFTADRFNLTMAGWSVHDTHIPTGTRLPIGGGTINELVYDSAAAARIESYADAEGALAELIRERGIKSEVAAPVVVEGQLWGCIIAGWDTDGAPPVGAERRLAGFAELVATAVSNALSRSELVASRARIVTAGDEARRNIERNLHDGVQQQLVAAELELKAVETRIPTELESTRRDLERLQGVLENVLDDVREISQGVHPATLSQWGLGPALRTLSRRSPIPVGLEIDVPHRLPDSVEIATYYVISEALANVTKHAAATHVNIEVGLTDDWLHASVRDDGVGGADTRRGSGLTGLVDRVEALGGRLSLVSAPQQGTTVAVALPLDAGSLNDL